MRRHRSQPRPGQPICVIPAHNEALAIGPLVQELTGARGYPVVVVNDASIDDTAEVARRNGAIVLSLAVNLGAWSATQAGLRYAVAQGYTRAVTLDGDGQHLPAAIPDLIAPLEAAGADVVIGRCIARASPARRLAWRVLRGLTRLPVADLTSGFRAYDSAALQILVEKEASLLEFQDVGVLSLLRAQGLRIVETEVPMEARAHGKSRVFYSWFAVAYYLAYTGILGASKMRRPGRGGLRPRA